MDKTIYYPYNDTFEFYTLPKAGKRAQQFVEEQNQCKGGHWVLHTKEQFNEWFERKGKHLQNLEMMGFPVPKYLGEL